jgi:ligand-binding sensor domain-containing protein
MNRVVCFLLLAFSCTALTAQDGHYYLSHYSSDQQAGSLCFDIAQDTNGLLYFATRTGLKQFDGRTWRAVASTSAVYTLSVNEKGEVFTGGEDGVGVITNAADFSLNVIPLYEDKNIDLFESFPIAEGTLFISETKLVVVNYKTRKAAAIKPPTGKEGFVNGFIVNGNTYVSTFDGTTYKVDGGKLTEENLRLGSSVLFTADLSGNYFIVTEEQKIFIAGKTGELRPLVLADDRYLKSSVIVNGCWVNSNLLAIGTLNGGVVFINPTTGKTEEIINYYSGLPDNEIFCIKRDTEGRVWVGHEYGYSAIAPNLPFRSFNHYDGLSGNILCAKTFDSKVYVGTSVGLFVLDKQDRFGEEVYYIEKKSTVQKKVEAAPANPAAQPKPEEKKKGLLRFLRKKEKSNNEQAPVETASIETKAETIVSRIRQTRKIVVGSTYVFRKIEGIDAKVTSLGTQNNKLYAAGLSGLFEVQDNKAVSIVKEPVVVFAATNNYGVVGVNYRNKVFSWDGKNNQTLIEDIRDDITAIVEDTNGELWLTGAKTIYKHVKNEKLGSYAYTNPALDQTVSMVLEKGPVFVNSFGFYIYNSGAVRVIDSLGKPTQFFASGNNVWFKKNDQWRHLGVFTNHKNLKYLNIFADLRYIEADDKSESLWVVTKDNKLFRFYTNSTVPENHTYPLIVRSVRNQKHFFNPGESYYVVEQSEGQLTVEVLRATFGSQQGVQYRFALEGPGKNNWSEWSGDGQFSFPYLPLGDYSLKLQARDVMGEVTELKPIRVKIEPPFWKTAWFYAMEFAVFSVLVILSIRLQAMNKRYRIVAQLLSMLTIVLLITFIQSAFSTYLSTTSPVIDFGIQVGIALLVLPVESFLRKVMFASGPGSKLYQFINPTFKKTPPEPLE